MMIQQKKGARQGVRLEPRQKVALEALPKRYDSTVSALIRAAVDQFIAQEQGAEAQVR
jgi:predicted transcriptional regulator